MTTPNTYDENLLAEAPEVTKADLQDGYNPDLLHEPTVARKNTTRGLSTPPRTNSDPHLQHYPLPNKDIESLATPLQPPGDRYEKPRKSFWRTKKALILIAILGILIILAAVLGGVLGSRKKDNIKNVNGNGSSPLPGQGSATSSVSTAPSTSTTARTQGAGSDAQGSPTPSSTSQPVASGSPGDAGQGTSGNGGTSAGTSPGQGGGTTTGDGGPPSGGVAVPASQPGIARRDANDLVSSG